MGADDKRRQRDQTDSSRQRNGKRERTEGSRRHRGGRHRGGRRRSRLSALETDHGPAPADFHCHICGRHHWTVDCSKLKRHPARYPMLDRRKGCRRCGQRGHQAAECTKVKYKCKECGGMHDSKDCIYDHVGEEWCEFVDPVTKHVFYANADESQVSWMPPTHELDTVWWYCPGCWVLNPNKTEECLKCHAERPSLKLPAEGHEDEAEEASSSSSSASSSDDDEGSLSDDSSSTTSESDAD